MSVLTLVMLLVYTIPFQKCNLTLHVYTVDLWLKAQKIEVNAAKSAHVILNIRKNYRVRLSFEGCILLQVNKVKYMCVAKSSLCEEKTTKTVLGDQQEITVDSEKEAANFQSHH